MAGRGIVEDGVVIGNTYDKYGSSNPVSRLLVAGFFRSFDRLVALSGASDINEVGCGEGQLSVRLAKRNKRVRASDISATTVQKAKELALSERTLVQFQTGSIYELDLDANRAELVVCCEVLEHLPDPREALRRLVLMADPFLLLSVPREPIWRILNLARLQYVSDLGNTPGHLQHWSKQSFLRLVQKYASIVQVDSPFPWTMLLAKRRH